MTETSVQTLVPGAESAADGDGTGEPQRSSKEARYRVERNEAQAALAAAVERIQVYQRAEVERLASDGLSHPADLFSLSGNELADYLTESGDVDAEKVAADVAAVLAERPGLRKNSPAFDPTQGSGGSKPKAPEPTWGGLFHGAETEYGNARAFGSGC